jgi:hypothetical protein
MSKEKATIRATIEYEGDTKKYHKFQVVQVKGYVVGTVYVVKTLPKLPDQLILERSTSE